MQVVMADGRAVEKSVEDICGGQLSSCGVVKQNDSGQWIVSDAAAAWLRNDARIELAIHIHANVKFFGELLEHLEGIHSKGDFLAAAHEYGLTWTSTDQLHRRVNWMELLGLIERWGNNRFVLTDEGKSFLERVELTTSDEATGATSVDSHVDLKLPPAGQTVRGLISNRSTARKIIIGYIPRGRKAPDRENERQSQSPIDAIRRLVDLMGDGLSADEFYTRCTTELGMKRASAIQTMHTMRQMHVFDIVSFNQFGPVPEVVELLRHGNELDLARFLHSRYAFFGEILTLIQEPTPVSEVARIARSLYRLEQIDNGEVRTRMGFLLEAGLVDRIDWTRYRTSGLGQLLSAEMTFEEAPSPDDNSEPSTNADHAIPIEDQRVLVTTRLRDFSTRSDTSEDFEKAVAAAFRYLGFAALHVGGSGRTDVIVDANLPTVDAFRAIVDAKSSASGMISDNSIKFDALKDHQRKHHADFGMVVGPDFTSRVRDWAINNNFTLLTVEDLVTLLERHDRYPLTLLELRELFQRKW